MSVAWYPPPALFVLGSTCLSSRNHLPWGKKPSRSSVPKSAWPESHHQTKEHLGRAAPFLGASLLLVAGFRIQKGGVSVPHCAGTGTLSSSLSTVNPTDFFYFFWLKWLARKQTFLAEGEEMRASNF